LPRECEVFELLEKPRLSDTRLARDDRELAVSRERGVEAPLQLREFLLAPDEDGQRRSLEHAAGRGNHREAKLVRGQARAVAAERIGDLDRLLGAFRRI